MKYRRVVLKLSGNAFCGSNGTGLNVAEIKSIASEVKAAAELGGQVAVVVGGGNLIRGAQIDHTTIDRVTGDYMGMLGTVINALALRDTLEAIDVPTRVQTAIPMGEVAEPYVRSRAISHLAKGRVVIFGGGTGNPYFTTDTTAALRAVEIEADVIFKATRVNGVFSDDPEKNPDAERFDFLTYMEVLEKRLKVMDLTAVTLCMEYGVPIVVFNVKEPGNILVAVKGEKIGTLVGGDAHAC